MPYRLTFEEICRRLKPIFGKKIDKLYLAYTLTDDRSKKEEIVQAINVLYEKYLNTTLLDEAVLLEPPQGKTVEGEYELGTVTYADKDVSKFGLRERDWARHVCVTGMSGSGKTMLAFVILKDMMDKQKPFVVFDWKKSFRPLVLMDKNILLFTIGNPQIANFFKTNINRPPQGVGPKEWIGILCDLITESFFASYGVNKLLRETLDQMFRDFGVYKGSNNYPTWYQVRDRLETKAENMKKGRESEWMESALRIAYSLTFGNFGDALNSKENYGIKIEELLDKKVIFELQTLNNAEKKFFCEYLLSYIYFTRKATSMEAKGLQSIILVDEAHNVFLKDRPVFVKETVTDMIYRELREYGVGLICLDQHISKLSETVAGNSATNIAFQQVLPHDVETISGIMQLREHRGYFTMLPIGTAIVKLAERYFRPFLVKVPFIEMKEKKVGDEVIKEKMSKVVKTAKRMKIFKEDTSHDKLIKKLARQDIIFKASGVRTQDDLKDMQAIQEKKEEKPAKAFNTVNHLQLFLVDEIKQFKRSGMEKKNIKDYLKKRGFKSSDIDRAFRNVDAKKDKDDSKTARYIEENEKVRKLLILVKKQALGTTELYKKLGVSAREGNELKKALLFLDLIKEVEQKNKKGWKKLIEITDKAKEFI